MSRWLMKLWRLPLRPRAEWDDIAAGSPAVPATLTGYLLPALALVAVCGFIGMHWVGLGFGGFSYKMPFTEALANALLGFAAALVGTGVLAWIANLLAPRFGATANFARAFAVAAFAAAPVHLAGLTQLLPMLALLMLPAAAYALYLLHLGLKRLMGPSEGKALPYSLTVIVCAILIGLLLTLLRGCSGSTPTPGMAGQAIEVEGDGGGTAAGKPEGRAVSPEELDEEEQAGGDGLRKVSELPDGTAGEMVIPPSDTKAMDPGEAMKGVLIPDMQAPTRSVLEEYLPAEIAGMKRKTVDSYAFRADPKTAAGFLSTGASASVGFQATDGSWNYIETAVQDQTTDKAQMMIGALKTELSMVGGVQRRDNGSVRRIGFDQGRWFIVEENDRRGERSLEWIVGERYVVKVSAKGYPMSDLERIAASMGIAALEKRARDKAPVE